jgi:hypothetical protein
MKWILGLLVFIFAVYGHAKQGFFESKLQTFSRFANSVALNEHYGVGRQRVSRLRFIDLTTGVTTATVEGTKVCCHHVD